MKVIQIKNETGNFYLISAQNKLNLYQNIAENIKEITNLQFETDFLIIPFSKNINNFATIGQDKKFRIFSLEKDLTKPINLLYCSSFPKKLTHGISSIIGGKEYCFIADKFGDVYQIDIEKAIKSHSLEAKMIRQDYLGPTKGTEDLIAKFIMGHQEIINFVLINALVDFLVTIDNANKIKVSKVPRFYEIFAIHFGHHAQICASKFVDNYELLTMDKNKEIILWDIQKDDEKAIILHEKLLKSDSNIMGMTMYGKNDLIVYFEDNSVVLYEISRATSKIIEKNSYKIPEDFNILQIDDKKLFSDSKITAIVENKTTKIISLLTI